MKTNRILAVTGVVCTLLAGVALALDAEDFEDVADFPAPADVLVGVDALADGSVAVYDGASVFVEGEEGWDEFTGYDGEAGFIAAAPEDSAEDAMVGAEGGTLWLFSGADAGDPLSVSADEGVVFGEYLDTENVLVSIASDTVFALGLVQMNSGELPTYTQVVDYNTSSMAPAGIVCIDDKVYVGDASGTIRSFGVADLTALADTGTPLSHEAGVAFCSAPNFGGEDGYGKLGPTSATPKGNLLVGGQGVIEVVQAEGGFLRRDGRVFDSVDFGTDLLYLPISVDGKILVADSSGGAQIADAEVDPGFFQNLFAPITQFFQWLWSLILGLFGLGA